MFLSTLVGQGQVPVAQVHQHRQCAYSFDYPTEWRIVKNPDFVDGDCATTLRPADYERRMAQNDVDVFTLTVQVSELSFLQQAAENGFDFDGKWVVMGRSGTSNPAQVSNLNGWLTLRGIAEVGCHHQKGGFAGSCDEFRSVAKHQDDARVVAIVGGAKTEEALAVVLKTFKFLSR